MQRRLQVRIAAKNVRYLSLRTELSDRHRCIQAYLSKHTYVAISWSRFTFYM